MPRRSKRSAGLSPTSPQHLRGPQRLARYDSGDEVGALAVLDKIQAADELARNTVNNVQKAVGERRLANLSFDALGQGKGSGQQRHRPL